jgi:hypothetical protein
MAGCVKITGKSVEHPLSPCVMKAPRAHSRRHLRVAFGFLVPDHFLQTPSTDMPMPEPMTERSGGTVLATMSLLK